MYLPDGKFLVDIPHGGSEVVSREEHANGNALAPHRSTVHDLVFGNSLVLMEGVGTTARCLSFYDGYFHVLDLDPNLKRVKLRSQERNRRRSHQKKVNFSNDDVFQMIL